MEGFNDPVSNRTRTTYYIVETYCKKKYLQITLFCFETIFVIYDYGIHNRRYIVDLWIRECVLALIFANAFEIANLHN